MIFSSITSPTGSETRIAIAPTASTLNLPVFRPPPLGAAMAVDVARELDALRRRRATLSERVGSLWCQLR